LVVYITTFRQVLASNRQLARKPEHYNLLAVHSAGGYCTFFFSSRFLLCASKEEKLNTIDMK